MNFIIFIILTNQRIECNIFNIMKGLNSHNHQTKYGLTTRKPVTQTPFVRDGILEDQIALDFEDGNNYSPWVFKDAVVGVGGRARKVIKHDKMFTIVLSTILNTFLVKVLRYCTWYL